MFLLLRCNAWKACQTKNFCFEIHICELLCLVYKFLKNNFRSFAHVAVLYEVCPESKDTKVLNMYNIFNLQKQHSCWHCPNIY
jgi:hypothetical protein